MHKIYHVFDDVRFTSHSPESSASDWQSSLRWVFSPTRLSTGDRFTVFYLSSCSVSLTPTYTLTCSKLVLTTARDVTGIGVDDMFVITQCYDQLTHSEKLLPMHQRIGLTLKHAGMSIFVTSITDICAFGIGSTTVSILLSKLQHTSPLRCKIPNNTVI